MPIIIIMRIFIVFVSLLLGLNISLAQDFEFENSSGADDSSTDTASVDEAVDAGADDAPTDTASVDEEVDAGADDSSTDTASIDEEVDAGTDDASDVDTASVDEETDAGDEVDSEKAEVASPSKVLIDENKKFLKDFSGILGKSEVERIDEFIKSNEAMLGKLQADGSPEAKEDAAKIKQQVMSFTRKVNQLAPSKDSSESEDHQEASTDLPKVSVEKGVFASTQSDTSGGVDSTKTEKFLSADERVISLKSAKSDVDNSQAELSRRSEKLELLEKKALETHTEQEKVRQDIVKNYQAYTEAVKANPNGDFSALRAERAELDKKYESFNQQREEQATQMNEAVEARDKAFATNDQAKATLDARAYAFKKIEGHDAEASQIRADIAKQEELARAQAIANAKATRSIASVDDTSDAREAARFKTLGGDPPPSPASAEAPITAATVKPVEEKGYFSKLSDRASGALSTAADKVCGENCRQFATDIKERTGNLIVGLGAGVANAPEAAAELGTKIKGVIQKSQSTSGGGSSMEAEGFTTHDSNDSSKPESPPDNRSFLTKAKDGIVSAGKFTGEVAKSVVTGAYDSAKILADGCTGTECTEGTVGVALSIGVPPAAKAASTALKAGDAVIDSGAAAKTIVAAEKTAIKEQSATVVEQVASREPAAVKQTISASESIAKKSSDAVPDSMPSIQHHSDLLGNSVKVKGEPGLFEVRGSGVGTDGKPYVMVQQIGAEEGKLMQISANSEKLSYKGKEHLSSADRAIITEMQQTIVAREATREAQQQAQRQIAEEVSDTFKIDSSAKSVKLGAENYQVTKVLAVGEAGGGNTRSAVSAAIGPNGEKVVIKQYTADAEVMGTARREVALTSLYEQNGIPVVKARMVEGQNAVVKEYVPGANSLRELYPNGPPPGVKADVERQIQSIKDKVAEIRDRPSTQALADKNGFRNFTDAKEQNMRLVLDPKTNRVKVILIDP